MNFLSSFGPQCTVSINVRDQESRLQAQLKKDGGVVELHPLFHSGETVAGEVRIEPLVGKNLEHNGVKIELLGQIELQHDRGNFHDFLSLTRDLEPPGIVTQEKKYMFEFPSVEMPYETYMGVNARLRYLLRVTIARQYAGKIMRDRLLVVRNAVAHPEASPKIKMEVGIEDCLHIEFEYGKSKYHLRDVIQGKIYFLLVRIKIKHMEIEIRRRESTGSGTNTSNETETIAKYEIMDGAPVRGETIPIRLFLSPYELTPTYANVNNKYSVRYFVNLVLVDEEDRRYFKQQEITLYRAL